jgi:hypothetical protein
MRVLLSQFMILSTKRLESKEIVITREVKALIVSA